MFAGGWDFIAQQYGHVGSYRYMELPGSRENHAMMVAGKDAFTGSIVDVESIPGQTCPGAGRGTRTRTDRSPQDFKSRVSTYSTSLATLGYYSIFSPRVK